MLPGKNATLEIKLIEEARDAHGAPIPNPDANPDPISTVDASIQRNSREAIWNIIVEGDWSAVGRNPDVYRLTNPATGEVYRPFKVSFRPPIESIGESAHTLMFVELVGERYKEVTA